jgi:hypothetical protein
MTPEETAEQWAEEQNQWACEFWEVKPHSTKKSEIARHKKRNPDGTFAGEHPVEDNQTQQ